MNPIFLTFFTIDTVLTIIEESMNKSKLIGAIVGIVAAVLVSTFVKSLFKNNEVNFDKTLMQVSNQLNESCPFMVDKDTRLDNSLGGPGKNFNYFYTLINISKSDIDPKEFDNLMRPNIIKFLKTSPDMKTFRDNNINMHYSYKDKNGEFFYKISIEASDLK